MFFILSKVFWLLVQPVSLAILLGLTGVILSFARWRWPSRTAVLLAVGVLLASAFTTLGYVLVQPLEEAFARPSSPPSDVAGIIVLGGGMDAEVNEARGGYELNRAGDRFVEALRLAAIYPTARIVVTGGLADIEQSGEPEAVAGGRFFLEMGIAEERLVLETASRNTEENAQHTRTLVRPAAGETWLLVTSAFHMPRSIGLFRKADFDVVPWPTDYRGAGTETFGITLHQPAENLTVVTLAIREWIGLIAYYLTGKIDALLPQPEMLDWSIDGNDARSEGEWARLGHFPGATCEQGKMTPC
jgi:uncharacterized SAM-binding protein YcdF (DUF218 family)